MFVLYIVVPWTFDDIPGCEMPRGALWVEDTEKQYNLSDIPSACYWMVPGTVDCE